MFAGLSLDQAPPFRAPLKFFLIAPLFAILAGFFALFSKDYFVHSTNLIANIHILTIGYILMIIFGALQQMLPVVAGVVIPKPTLVANITFWSMVLGIISFVLGFLFYNRILFDMAAILLFLGIGFFLSISIYKLYKVENKSYIVKTMLISLIILFMAIILGTHLVISYATGNFLSYHLDIALIHYNLIFFGGLFLLIAAITFQVVPMFWVAKDFNKKNQQIILYATIFSLILLIINISLGLNLYLIYKIFIGSIILFFSYITYNKLKSRRRKLTDYTVYFYYSSILFLISGVIYYIAMSFLKLPIQGLIILFGIGFVISLMNGMIYKIIPFLTWFHLNSKGIFDIPTMRDMIPIKLTKMQFYCHISSVILFFIGFAFEINIIIKIASMSFILSNIILFYNITSSSKIFLKRDK